MERGRDLPPISGKPHLLLEALLSGLLWFCQLRDEKGFGLGLVALKRIMYQVPGKHSENPASCLFFFPLTYLCTLVLLGNDHNYLSETQLGKAES